MLASAVPAQAAAEATGSLLYRCLLLTPCVSSCAQAALACASQIRCQHSAQTGCAQPFLYLCIYVCPCSQQQHGRFALPPISSKVQRSAALTVSGVYCSTTVKTRLQRCEVALACKLVNAAAAAAAGCCCLQSKQLQRRKKD
jgi:hypothetical protein